MPSIGVNWLLSKYLVGFLFAIHIGSTHQQDQLKCKHCVINQQWIACSNITTKNVAIGSKEWIAASIKKSTRITSIKLERSDIDIFPNDFFAPYNVTELSFHKCNVSQMPNRILDPISPKLTRISFESCNIKSKHLPAGMLRNCTNVQHLWIKYSGIETVSSKTFEGLSNLQKLDLSGNEIEGVAGFQGIEKAETIRMAYNKIRLIDKITFKGLSNLKVLDLRNNRLEVIHGFPENQRLEEIDLSNNNISSIDKNAFKGLDNLKTLWLNNNRVVTFEEELFEPLKTIIGLQVYIHANPYHCNCSLKWLQKLKNHQYLYDYVRQDCLYHLKKGNLDLCDITTLPSTKYQEKTTTSEVNIGIIRPTKSAILFSQWLAIGLMLSTITLVGLIVSVSTAIVIWIKTTRLSYKTHAKNDTFQMETF